jgi:hypothetical protein
LIALDIFMPVQVGDYRGTALVRMRRRVAAAS